MHSQGVLGGPAELGHTSQEVESSLRGYHVRRQGLLGESRGPGLWWGWRHWNGTGLGAGA